MKKILTIIVPILSAFILNSCQKDMVFDLYGDSFKIYYTTVDGRIISLNNAFSRKIISHTYENGQGVIITNEAIKEIVESCFQGRIELTSITIPDSVTLIEGSAFRGCSSLTSITIPDGVTSIGDYAFAGCSSLTSVTIGNGITSIGEGVFQGCTGELVVNCNIPSVSSYHRSAFYMSEFTKVTIGNSVTEIGKYAFYCTPLTSVTIPNSVTSIGEGAFYNCASLKNAIIPNSVTEIEMYAFCGCESLASVTISDRVTEIGEGAFYYCSSLTSVYCKPTTPPTGGSGMFSHYHDNEDKPIGCTIYVPRNSVSAYKSAEYWSDYKSYIEGYDF